MKDKANRECLPCEPDLILREGDMVFICRTLIGLVHVDNHKISKEWQYF